MTHRWKDYGFNIIKFRDPTQATLGSGDTVHHADRVYFKVPADSEMAGLKGGDWLSVKCADYHTEHFLYIDPLYLHDKVEGKGHWFAMCTCGSPAVLVGPTDAAMEDSSCPERLLVCYLYHLTLTQTGHGRHATTGERPWS